MAENNSGMGAGVGGLALAGAMLGGTWLVLKYMGKKDSDKATKEANEKALAYQVSTQATKQRIAKIEQTGAWRSGINGYKKNVTVNVITEAKDAIRSMYSVSEMKGITKYAPKSKSNIKAGEFVNSVFSIPLNALATFSKVYTIYTGQNVLDDASKLDYQNYANIKALFSASKKNFPDTWK